MKVIGLAGGAGCGKSAVAQELAKREGIARIDLDKVAWETYRPRSPTYWRLVSRFGEGILDADGTIDRARLARIAFSDQTALDDLNAIVHPVIIDHLQRIIRNQKNRGTKILLVEGALLGTSPYVDRSLFDVILSLEVSEGTRKRRLRVTGREGHTKRKPQEPPTGVVRIDAEGAVRQVIDRVLAVIESP